MTETPNSTGPDRKPAASAGSVAADAVVERESDHPVADWLRDAGEALRRQQAATAALRGPAMHPHEVEALLPDLGSARLDRVIRYSSGPGFERVELRGPSRRRMVRGIASTATIDSENRSFLPWGCRVALPLPLLFEHGRTRRKYGDYSLDEMRVGEIVLIVKTAQAVVVECVLNSSPAADRAWQLIQDGTARSLSGGFTDLHLNGIADDIQYFDTWALREVSICLRGANPDARLFPISYSEDFV